MKQGVTKAQFVGKLEELLRLTREGVERLELEQDQDDEFVTIIYGNGVRKKVDITLDSGCAIIKDVARKV